MLSFQSRSKSFQAKKPWKFKSAILFIDEYYIKNPYAVILQLRYVGMGFQIVVL